MPLDADEVRIVNLLEHKVRHLLGLHSGLARYLLNEVPDEAVEIRRIVGLHEAKIPELESTLAGVFESLLARAAPQSKTGDAAQGDAAQGEVTQGEVTQGEVTQGEACEACG